MVSMNIFRILGDVSHTLSKCILIYSIHSNSSAEGVSLITQTLYCVVFITRYLDLFNIYSYWNFILQIFYILSSLYIIFLMMRVYARTREREKAWKFGGACFVGSAVLAPFVMMIFLDRKKNEWGFLEVLWIFSIILESVCVLPQLLLLRQTTVPTVIDSYYLLTLGSYRGFYVLNWIWREVDENDRKPYDFIISVIFGVIQTAFYVDFFWVYYSRQRVKLRHGGIVDQDDMRNGWLLRRIFGNKHVAAAIDETEGDDEESAPALGGNGSTRKPKGKWGARGISVSADDDILDAEGRTAPGTYDGQEDGIIGIAEEGDQDAKMRDPDELAKILEDDDDDEDILPAAGSSKASKAVGNGDEWND